MADGTIVATTFKDHDAPDLVKEKVCLFTLGNFFLDLRYVKTVRVIYYEPFNKEGFVGLRCQINGLRLGNGILQSSSCDQLFAPKQRFFDVFQF